MLHTTPRPEPLRWLLLGLAVSLAIGVLELMKHMATCAYVDTRRRWKALRGKIRWTA